MRGSTGRDGTGYVPDENNVQVRGHDGQQVTIRQDWPPRIEQIEARFGKLPDSVIFAWGDTIFVPGGAMLPPWLLEHELTHLDQQKDFGGVDPWWDRYLIDDGFRLEMELEAHQVEYKMFCRAHPDRNLRVQYLHSIASRLSDELYGSVITKGDAIKRIRGNIR